MNLNYEKLSDGTIIDSNGKIIFFSTERFIKDIVERDFCFLCGANPDEKEFNNEHIIPDWILRKYKLHDKQINLPNDNSINYSQYKVACCRECNTFLGEKIEDPISEIISGGYENLLDYLSKNGTKMFHQWLNLLFIKTHLKDKKYRFFTDKREPNYKISEMYDWESLHHIHCIARSIYTDCSINSRAYSSLIILPALKNNNLDPFDYKDYFMGKGLLLKMNDICFISILNDSGGTVSLFRDAINKISGPVSSLQSLEIISNLVFLNLNLKVRPKHFSQFDMRKGESVIMVDRPDIVEYEETSEFDYGTVFYDICKGAINALDNSDRDEIIRYVKKGQYSFLFNEKREFIKESMIFKEIKIND